MWPRFEEVHRSRPLSLISTERTNGFLAPWATVEASLSTHEVNGRLGVGFTAASGHGPLGLEAWYDGGRRLAGIDVTGPAGARSHHRSRRHGRPDAPPDGLAMALTGTQVTTFTRSGAEWTARARVELDVDVDPGTLSPVQAWLPREDGAPSPVAAHRSGVFGQLGLRDVHVVTHADGSPVVRDGLLFVTATHAGPGFFSTARCGVWAFEPATFALEHRADLWFRRDGVVHGDHAVHLVRDGGRWLVAASTWSTFDIDADEPHVTITLASSADDLLTGEHVLDARPLDVPTEQLPPPVVGCWDPHLTLIDDHWHLAFVAARRFFEFHPVLARAGRAHHLGDWQVLGAADDRVATEGTVITRIDGQWRVLASDGPDSPRRLRRRFPVFDLTMTQVDTLDADYPTNLPWPSVIPGADGGALMVTFDGTRAGGRLLGYGTHGDFVVLRTNPTPDASYPAPEPCRQDRP